ncbi:MULTISPECIES: hypothetical protein [unclassified Janthinobacterium]|uniref:alpha-glutamyl/putrescinyl thymine pyrophosphorylase clade 3 protein n=1 Tax=unclassified Janthinobacterium TaxID=2610881 RepID=UPI000889910D|nr:MULTISPECIES: hypothetical protein [unclassified Janthinobacterium]SDA86613.1 hypothetical protein SAMN03159349_05611 [Janthinobacterium sp. 551a]SDA86823.1 hypothetical protein SAMN03159349_05636 [Janthinobacterium sp. 551a]SFB66157.1 hypothetical protein SAMN03159300_12215 [Janthinobacterium sp. 344]
MKPKDIKFANGLKDKLVNFDKAARPLPGLNDRVAMEVFLEQIVESVHRVKYISLLMKRDISPLRANSKSEFFDPEKAAIYYKRVGNIDEACWLVFLSVFFGKNLKGGWRYLTETYDRLGQGGLWDWNSVKADPDAFGEWILRNQHILKRDGVRGGFGNHRKYNSLTQAPKAVKTYIEWVGNSHLELFDRVAREVGADRRKQFAHLYRTLNSVFTLGRTGKFDYLTMIGKMGLATIEPGSAYMAGATGPLAGARLLFGGVSTANLPRVVLDKWLVELEADLGVGMQVMEDSLCNWQKNPAKFVAFRG